MSQAGRYAKNMGTHWRTRARAVSLPAEGLNTRGESYCADVQSDGVVHDEFIGAMCGGKTATKIVAELVAAGWWKRVERGYEIVGYLDRNISRGDDEARRKAGAERVAKHRGNRVTDPPDNDGGNGRRNGAGNALHEALPLTQDTKTPRHQDTRSSLTSFEKDSRGREVTALFEHWRSAMGKSGAAKLDLKRRRRCEWAIAEYGLELSKLAIDGCARSDWHMGRDPRSPGSRYDDLTLIFRDSTHFERFRDMASAPRSGRSEPLPNSAYRGTSQAEMDEMFGDVTDEEIAQIGRGKHFYG